MAPKLYRLFVYRNSPDLREATRPRQDEVLSNVKRALEYMGHKVEIEPPELLSDDFKKLGPNTSGALSFWPRCFRPIRV